MFGAFFGIGRTSSTSQGRFIVTVYRHRKAVVAMRMELGASFFSFVKYIW